MPSLYDNTIPIFIKFLNNLSHLLKEGVKYADDHGIEHTAYLQDKLAPDMLGFIFQVQTVCNVSKNLAQRVGGIEPVVVPDDETTFEQLQNRVQKTIEILKTVKKDVMDKNENIDVSIKTNAGEMHQKGAAYVNESAIPNFYFHLTTTYVILRKNGVPLGKFDYLLGRKTLAA